MNKLSFLLSVLFCMNVQAQLDDVWIRAHDNKNPELVGYVDLEQNIKIPFGKYLMCFTDTFKAYAIVAKEGEGFIGINRQEEKLFAVFPFDNGPDCIKDGLFRIVDGSRMGFANSTGIIVIPPQFDFAFAFEHGLAIVNNGGKSESTRPNYPNCEYHVWKGGKWGVIDKEGHLVLSIKYDYVRDEETQVVYLIKGKVKYQLLDGELVRCD